jgi:hypothetical protein
MKTFNLIVIAAFLFSSNVFADTPDPTCEVASVVKLPTVIENDSTTPSEDFTALSQPDANGIYQLYTQVKGAQAICTSCNPFLPFFGGPGADRDKMMVSTHPSGQWIMVGVEQDFHDYWWVPKTAQPYRNWMIGIMQTGAWLNMWVTDRTGSRWYRLSDFSSSAQANGFTGTAFTPGGKTAVWTELQNGSNMATDPFGVWKLYAADFGIGANGNPGLFNKRDITPPGARWVEPGNVSPDGRRILLSTDIGLASGGAEGQDQWSLEIFNDDLQQITNTPYSWDEHGLYSPNGKKVVFMSSYPFRNDNPNPYHVAYLKSEFMIINSDGSQIQQLTHFNDPGYPEYQGGATVAAVAAFLKDGTLFATVMAPGYTFGKTNWKIAFTGTCGLN